MDESLEEAAFDLGARPAKVFFVITLPIIAPALISGWLLSFTISRPISENRIRSVPFSDPSDTPIV